MHAFHAHQGQSSDNRIVLLLLPQGPQTEEKQAATKAPAGPRRAVPG